MNKLIYCPLCESKTPLEYKEWMSTHIWTCKECPFLAFEYYDNKDMEKLQDYLNFNPK